MPHAMIAETASPASSIESKPASSVSTASGRRSSRSVALVTTASVPSDPTSTPSRSRPGRIEHGAAEVHQLAVRQHRFDAEHVVHGEAVLQAVRAAGVLGDVAADRADDLARRIGRVVAARTARRACVISRFVTPGSTVTRRFGMSMSRTRFRRDRTISTPSGCGSAPPDSPVPWPRATNGTPAAVAEPDDRLHFGGVGRKHDRARRRAGARARPTRTSADRPGSLRSAPGTRRLARARGGRLRSIIE